MVRTAHVLLLALTGCDNLFNLLPVGPADGDARSSDGSPDTGNASVDGGPTGCPLEYMMRLETTASFYKLVTNKAVWADAEMDCADDVPTGQTHLIVLSNSDEWNAVIKLPAAAADDVWIGAAATRNGGFQYLWVTAENTAGYVIPAVTGQPPWYVDEPDGGSQCVNLHASTGGTLHDSACTNANYYICECDGHIEVPANF